MNGSLGKARVVAVTVGASAAETLPPWACSAGKNAMSSSYTWA